MRVADERGARRGGAWGGAGLALAALSLAALARPEPSPVTLVVFESPSPAVLQAIATSPDVDVRWAEAGLVVAEMARPDRASAWGGRIVAQRRADQELGLLHRRDAEAMRADPQRLQAVAGLGAYQVGVAHATAGDLLLLIGAPGAWPNPLLGCHGGLILPRSRVDPRSLIDAGPPPEILPWVRAPARAPSAGGRRLLASVSPDSLLATMNLLTRDEIGLAADRYVFSDDLTGLYAPRIESAMQRAVQGVAAATVVRQEFTKRRLCPLGVDTTSTFNLVARIPGSVPGTGTFVVCAHIDATGQRDSTWQAARSSCTPPVATPGGEDNATGVACVVEILRCVADVVRDSSVAFAPDLEFIAFSGEEAEGMSEPGKGNSLTGSRVYVEERQAAGTKLLGAFNMDMVGSDSLGDNLQIVHNTASTWLADFVIDAARAVGPPEPPIALHYTRDLDESEASDHNSFWAANAPAILAADAPVRVLRRYATYHRPLDTGVGRDVHVDKMAEVARTLLAALLRFDTHAPTEPEILFPPEALRLFLTIQGTRVQYDRTLRLWPGSLLSAHAAVYGLGSSYSGPLQVEMWLANAAGHTRTVFTCTDAACYQAGGAPQGELPTGGRLDFVVDPVQILPEDGGTGQLRARITYAGPGGNVVLNAADTLVVSQQAGLAVLLRPNPLRTDPATAQVAVGLERPGTLQIDVYNLEGELVSRSVQPVQPRFQAQSKQVSVPLLSDSAHGVTLRSGTYIVRVRWTSTDGQEESAVRPLVVIR